MLTEMMTINITMIWKAKTCHLHEHKDYDDDGINDDDLEGYDDNELHDGDLERKVMTCPWNKDYDDDGY